MGAAGASGAIDVYQNNTSGYLGLNTVLYQSNTTMSYVQGGAGTVVMAPLTAGTDWTGAGAVYLNGGSLVIPSGYNLGDGNTGGVILNGGTLVGATVNAADVVTGGASITADSTAARAFTLLSNGGGLAAVSGGTLTIDGRITSAAGTGPLVIGIPASSANGNVSGLLPGTGNGTANTTPVYGNGTVVLSYANGANGNSQFGGTTILGGATLNINSQYDLGGANQGPTTFNNGTLQYATTLATGAAGTALDISGQAVTFTGNATIDTNTHAVTYANAIGNGGSGSLTVVSSTAGNGSLTLSGANSYSGGTTLSSGSLILTNGASLANGAVNIGNGTTFKAFGNTTIGSATGGSLTLNSGSNFSLGNGTVSAPTGTLTLPYSGATALITGGNMTFYIGGSGTLSDEINVIGNVTSGSLTTIYAFGFGNNTPALNGGNASYVLINSAGINGGNFTLGSGSTITINNVIYNASLSGNSTDEFLNISTVQSGDYYWAGNDSGNGTSWSVSDNFIGASTGNATESGPPTALTNVHETAASSSHPSQTLDGSYTINSLTFNSSSGNISIAPGSGSNSLTLTAAGNFSDGSSNYLAGIGLVTQAGSGNQTISAKVILGNSQTWEIDGANPLTVSGVITNAVGGNNSLTKTGNGTLILSSGGNTYSGGTIISAGTIQLGAANTLLTTGSLQVSGTGSTFDLNGNNQAIGSLSDGGVSTGTVTSTSGNATLTVNNSSPNTFSGSITGSLGLTLAGTSSLVLSGANSYSGLTSLNGGVLKISATNNLGNSAATNSISFNGGTLESTANTYDLGANRAIALAGNGTIQTDSGAALTVSGNITGNNTLSVTGNGTLTLSGTSTFNGLSIANGSSLNIAGGSLTLSNAAPAVAGNPYLNYISGGNNTSVYVSGGSLTYANDGAASDDPNQALIGNFIQTGGNVTTEESNLAPTSATATTMFLGGGNYTSNLGKYGAFTVGTRGAANVYVDGGNLTVNGNASFPLIVGAQYNGGTGGTRAFVQQSGTVTTTGLTLGGLNGVGVNSPGVYYLNSGTLTTSTLNRGYDTNANQGTGTLNFGGGTFKSGTAFTTDANIVTNINSGGATIDTSGGNITWAGPITAGTTGNVNGFTGLNGGSGYTTAPTVIVSAPNSGNNTATAVAILNASGSVTDVVITNPGSGYTSAPSFTFGSGNASVTGIAPAIGNGGLTKVGSNTLALNGINTYLGPTTVNAGTLAFGAASSFASTAYNVAGGATLDVSALASGFALGGGKTLSSTAASGATATVNGNVTLSGGTLGTGIVGSTLQIGNLSLSSGNLNFAITDSGNTSGSSSLVNVPGALTLTGGSVALSGGNFTTGTNYTITYDLFQYGSESGNATTALSVAAASQVNGLTYTFGQSGGNVTLTISGSPHSQSGWITDGNGSWGNSTNWNGGVPNAQFTEAQFGGAAATHNTLSRTVTLDGNQTVGAMNFSSPNGESYTISQGSGGSLILDNGNTTAIISASGTHNIDSTVPIQLNSNLNIAPTLSSDSIAIAGVISNGPGLGANGLTSATLTKTGAGTLILSTANTYGPASGTVGTYLNAGITQVGNDTSLGAGDVAFDGTGTLQAGPGNLTLANNLTIGSGDTATLDSKGTAFTVSGVISDSSSNGLVVTNSTGTGKVILTNTNTYSGPTGINGGTLAISSANNLGSTSSINFNVGTLESTASVNYTLSANVTLPGAGTIQTDSSTSALTLNGVVSGAGSLTKTGNGTLVLSGNNSYSGATNVSAGILNLQNNNALGTSSATTETSGAAVQLQGGITIGVRPLILTGTGISDGGALENVSGSNSYGGNGVSTFVASIKIIGATRINADGGSTLAITGGIIGGNTTTGANPLTLGGNGTINITSITNPATGHPYGIDTATNNVTYDGNGTLNLGLLNADSSFNSLTTGVNNFSGNVSITGGIVNANYGTAATAGSSLGYTNQPNRNIAVQNAVLNFNAANVLGSPNGFAAANYPTLSLTNSTWNLGIVASMANGYSPPLDNNTVGALTLNGATVNLRNSAGNANFDELGLVGGVTVSGNASSFNAIAPGSGVSDGINLGMGSSLVAGYQTTFNVAATTGGTSGGTNPDLTINASLVNGTNNVGTNGTVLSTGLIKTGAGLMVLEAANSYTGITTVSAGTLQLSDGSTNGIASSSVITIGTGATLDVTGESSGSGMIVLNSAQVLGGNGTVKGSVEVASGSTISAGTSTALKTGSTNTIGTLTTTAGQTWDGNGTYVWKITSPGSQAVAGSGTSGTPGATQDALVLNALTVNSSVTTSTPFTISLTTAAATNGGISGTNGEYSWIVAQTGSSSLPTGISDNKNLLPGGNSTQAGDFVLNTANFSMNGVAAPASSLFSLEFAPVGADGNYDLVLDYAAAPEPGTALLVMGGVVPMLMGRRRRKSKDPIQSGRHR
jgi:fibronectin-binding autotransporter adhesin